MGGLGNLAATMNVKATDARAKAKEMKKQQT